MKKTTLFSLLTMLFLFVGSNAWADTYSYTFGSADLVKDTEGTISVTLDGVDWTIAMDGGKVSVFDNDKGAHFGTNNATCNSVSIYTAGIPGTISSVTVEASRGKNLVGTMEVLVGGTSYSFGDGTTTALTPENAAYEFVGSASGDLSIVWTKNSGQGAFYVKSITIEYSEGGIVVARPVITPNGGTFFDPQEVTITAEPGNYIFYTLDGTDPTDESTPYTASFILSENCTVKAIAYDVDDNVSSIATAVFKFAPTYTTIGALCAGATDEEKTVLVEFNGWFCTGVKNSNAYFTDGEKGILIYQSGHGFEVGDVLKGTASVKLVLYNECPEVTGLTATTEGLIVEKGAVLTPQTVAIADLEKDMQGCLITLEGVTYSKEGNVFIDDDDNEIIPYNNFTALPELFDGKTYNATGVAIWFKSKQKWEIAPRTADEFVLITSLIAPESSWSVESEAVDINGTPTATFTTNSDGVVTYESSDVEVATIDENGVITPVGRGIATITAFVAESEIYLADSKSFTLTVTENGYADAVFAYNDADLVGQGAPDTGAELSAGRNEVLTLFANKAYDNSTGDHIKIYGSKYETVGEGDEAEKVLSEPSYIQLSVVEGYSIIKIVLTATNESYLKEWKDQFGTDAVLEGATATWEGDMTEVILTNQATSQARIKTIEVTYIDTSIVDAISAPTIVVGGEEAIYNLAGQRLSRMQKGINIVGGKKILK